MWMLEYAFPFHPQKYRRHETTTNRKSVKNWYTDYIEDLPTALFYDDEVKDYLFRGSLYLWS